MKLSDRLALLASLVPQGSVAADVGTDHGFLPIYLRQTGICPKVVLSDVNPGPLEKARENIARLAPELPAESWDIRLGSGLETLKTGEADTVIIAGMGGRLIRSLLEEEPKKTAAVKRFLLQPRSSAGELRQWLLERGFTIEEDILVEEREFLCQVMAVVPPALERGDFPERKAGRPQYSALAWGNLGWEISPLWFRRKDPLLAEFLQRKLQKQEEITEAIRTKGGEEQGKALRQAEGKLRTLNVLLQKAENLLAKESAKKQNVGPNDDAKKEKEQHMAMDFKEFIQLLNNIAPKEMAEDWDNSGMQINMGAPEVRKVLVALEITGDVIEEATELGVDMIVTHHPLLFNPLKKITGRTVIGDHIIKLIRRNISVYSSHTNFDKVFGGNNDYMAELLGLSRVRRLLSDFNVDEEEVIGRQGELPKTVTLEEFVNKVKRVLNLKTIKVIGDLERPVRSVGLCTGSGGAYIEAARRNGCDVFLTGEVRYHEGIKAKETNMAVIDAGHFGTEWIFVENFARRLEDLVEGKVEVFASKVKVDPFNEVL
ncbi:MAG: Nif3-like dinuclear metal center hexameric protein [Firmicutes bacterium]|nr:Nif3-like dinuclear metal center hexameric protein [Bacillota bacterium]